mgnify:CR=1 FL=1
MTMNRRDNDKTPEEWPKALDDALSLMEQAGDDSPEEIRKKMADPETMQACRLLYKYKDAIGRTCIAKPDVEKEWQRFQARNKPRVALRRRHFWMGGMAGVAAVALVLLCLWHGGLFDKPEPVTVYKAVETPRTVVLQTEDGMLALDKEGGAQAAMLQGVANQTDTATLAYVADGKSNADQLHTLSTPSGKDFKLILADGTVVWLNDKSRLQYPASFTGKERKVRLYGEAYFQVAKKENNAPFIVETDHMQVRVLGTEFNLSDHADLPSHVTLIKGSVEVCGAQGGNFVRVKPGEDARLNDDGSFSLRKVDTDVYVYWKDGYFFFDDAPLSEIMQRVGCWYNVDVVFNNPRAMSLRLHYFCERSAGIEGALEQLNFLQKVKAEYRDGVVYID